MKSDVANGGTVWESRSGQFGTHEIATIVSVVFAPRHGDRGGGGALFAGTSRSTVYIFALGSGKCVQTLSASGSRGDHLHRARSLDLVLILSFLVGCQLNMNTGVN